MAALGKRVFTAMPEGRRRSEATSRSGQAAAETDRTEGRAGFRRGGRRRPDQSVLPPLQELGIDTDVPGRQVERDQLLEPCRRRAAHPGSRRWGRPPTPRARRVPAWPSRSGNHRFARARRPEPRQLVEERDAGPHGHEHAAGHGGPSPRDRRPAPTLRRARPRGRRTRRTGSASTRERGRQGKQRRQEAEKRQGQNRPSPGESRRVPEHAAGPPRSRPRRRRRARRAVSRQGSTSGSPGTRTTRPKRLRKGQQPRRG